MRYTTINWLWHLLEMNRSQWIPGMMEDFHSSDAECLWPLVWSFEMSWFENFSVQNIWAVTVFCDLRADFSCNSKQCSPFWTNWGKRGVFNIVTVVRCCWQDVWSALTSLQVWRFSANRRVTAGWMTGLALLEMEEMIVSQGDLTTYLLSLGCSNHIFDGESQVTCPNQPEDSLKQSSLFLFFSFFFHSFGCFLFFLSTWKL